MDYIEYIENVMDKLEIIQDGFLKTYKTGEYDNWYYNQSTELLRLYSDDKEIFFKYIPIGTYSADSNTWMWSWNNNDSIEQSKFQTLSVKDFGEKFNFEKLKNGYLECDEYAGWEYTAISMDILKGIGGYKVNSDHLEKYFLLTRVVEKKEVEEIEKELIDCNIHDKSRKAFICCHLSTTEKTGFEEAFPTYRGMKLEKDDDLQAWCSKCEEVRLECDGWNEESMKFAKIKLVCESCYFHIKDFNEK